MRRATILLLQAALGIGFPSAIPAQDSGPVPLKAATFYPPSPYCYVYADVSAVERSRDGGSVYVRFRPLPDESCHGQIPFERRSIQLGIPWVVGNGPVPVCVGQHVVLRLSPADEVLVVAYTIAHVVAGRCGPDGRWEFIVTNSEKRFLRLAPRAFDSFFTEVRWTKKYGLVIANFADGEYGGGETEDIESTEFQKRGWPIANQPGPRILPGRDGWVRFPKIEDGPIKGKDTARWMANEVPRSQRLP